MCAATTIAADKSLRLVIRFLYLDNKSQNSVGSLFGSGEAIDRLKQRYLHTVSKSREVMLDVFNILNWFLIEKTASGRHVSDGSRSLIALPGVSLG
jgi:hypothetical protein